MLAWPAESTKRSRSAQSGRVGEGRRYRVQRTYAMAAAPMGAPGWPLLACWTPSMDRVRMVSTASWWSAGVIVVVDEGIEAPGLGVGPSGCEPVATYDSHGAVSHQ